MTFAEAVDDLNALVKSKRARSQSVREMSDSKDYMEANADAFDRRAEGARRKDIRESNREWAGIQALDDDFDYLEADADMIHEMLVSGRPSKIRFPGAHADSEITPFNRQKYVEPTDEDEVELGEGQGEGRSRIGGDRVARRTVRPGMDSDAYTQSKSFGGRSLSPLALLKSFNSVKSRLHAAMMDEQIDPNILLNYDAAGTETRLGGVNLDAAMRALAQVAPSVRARYGIPTIAYNQWEEQGRIWRAL